RQSKNITFNFQGRKFWSLFRWELPAWIRPSLPLTPSLRKLTKQPISARVLGAIVSQLFELPPLFEKFLEKRLSHLGYSINDPQRLADGIRRLSNAFLKGEHPQDYWSNADFRAAYISYFSVLNFLRARSVFKEAKQLGFLKG